MAISNEQLIGALKKYPIVVICIVLSLGVAVTAYLRADLASQAKVELEEMAKKGKRMAANIKNSSELDEQLQTMTAANHEIDGRLVRFSQLAGNLQYFYELEATTGTKLLDLRQLASAKKSPSKSFEPVNFSVAVSGTYPQLIEFLQRLEGGKHFCRILSASFMPLANDNGGLSLGRPEALTITLALDLLGQP
jgi:hypothetical protein